LKVLFIDSFQNIRAGFFSYSIGLLSLASILKEKDQDAEIINFEYLFSSEIIPYFSEPEKKFEIMADYIVNKNPFVAGFTSICNSFHNTLMLSRLVKEKNKDIKIILGGPHVFHCPERVLENYSWIDLVCIGEGEKKIEPLIEGLKNNKLHSVPGIVYRENGNIIKNEDIDLINNLDELPFLNYEMIPYFKKSSYMTLEIGRGCPYNCIYCSTCRFWRRKFRIKSVERIIKEIMNIKNMFGPDYIVNFEFIHDNFTTDYDFVMGLMEKLKDIENIEWSCGARLDTLDEKLIKEMALAGCNDIYIGMETASPEMQKYIKKKLDLNRVYEIVSLILENNINPTVAFMYGFPEEKEEDLHMTLNMIYSLLNRGVEACHFNALSFLVGTELLDNYKDKLVLRDYYSGLVNIPSNFEFAGSFIIEDRELFSHFYTLEGGLADKYYLLENFMCYIVISLYQFFRKTINLLIKSFKNNILAFYNDFLDYVDPRFKIFFRSKEYMRDFIEDIEVLEHLIIFLGSYLRRKSFAIKFKVILNTFEVEYCKYKMEYASHRPKIRATKSTINRDR